MNKLGAIRNGLIDENPTFRLVLGMCPTLAVTTLVMNGIAMGLATTFVLIFSNLLISLMRNFIPPQIRLPAFIVIIATFVTVVDLVMSAFLQDMHDALGIYIKLIVVNCIVMARAESFASKNGVAIAALDGLGMGLGFTCALILLSTVRELLGSGTLLGFSIFGESYPGMSIINSAPGGFLCLGILMAIMNIVLPKLGKTPNVQNKKEDEA